MTDILVVIDMQNDFIDGALGTHEAEAIVPAVKKRIEEHRGEVYFTRDTHSENYLSTEEGKKLPVVHCVRGTRGWEIRSELDALRKTPAIDKPTFGSVKLAEMLFERSRHEDISITLIGVCTDICVLSNAVLLKAYMPEVQISVEAQLCAGVTKKSHENALEAMKMCQISVI